MWRSRGVVENMTEITSFQSLTEKYCLQEYFDYWKSDVWGNFGGVPKEQLNENYLEEYVAEGILIYDQDKKDEVDNLIMRKGYTRVNICPAIYLEHYISQEDAMKLDKEGKLISYITSRMKEVLGILDFPLNEVIK
jgi:hypothetical protein